MAFNTSEMDIHHVKVHFSLYDNCGFLAVTASMLRKSSCDLSLLSSSMYCQVRKRGVNIKPSMYYISK